MKVIFLGTPEFALGTLEMLIKEHEVVLCVTKPDAPKGRGGQSGDIGISAGKRKNGRVLRYA